MNHVLVVYEPPTRQAPATPVYGISPIQRLIWEYRSAFLAWVQADYLREFLRTRAKS